MILFDKMVDMLTEHNKVSADNAIHEVMQRIALAGLARGGFFEKAAFYGGTCLHLLFGLDRFSEDLDFSLLKPDLEFKFEDYFPAVVEEFKLAGKDVEIKLKRKGQPSSIESAFLKETSDVFDIGFTTEKRLKVKIEVDINPPPKFNTVEKAINMPRSCWVRSYDLPGLFAGKVSAALFRNWKQRVKGRDWYDILWYITNGVELDLTHLAERAREFGSGIEISSREAVIAALAAKIETVDFDAAREDVVPFVENVHDLDCWNRELFRQSIQHIRVQPTV